MEPDVATDCLKGLLNRIASIIFDAANSEVEAAEWSLAYLDVRGRPMKNSSLLKKYRIKRTDGIVIYTLDSPDDLMLPLRDVFNLKDTFLADKWYGLLITVYPDKQCEVKFDYDENCAKDKTFFDS